MERIWARAHLAASRHLLASSQVTATGMRVFSHGWQQRAQCQCLSGTASGWRDVCVLPCASAPGKGKGYLMSQGWLRGGRRQSLIENACKPHMCSLVVGTQGSGHGDPNPDPKSVTCPRRVLEYLYCIASHGKTPLAPTASGRCYSIKWISCQLQGDARLTPALQ